MATGGVTAAAERCHCVQLSLGRVEYPERTCPVHKIQWEENQTVLDHVRDRLSDTDSPGQCILHLGPGGEIRRVEWRSTEKKEDILG